MEPAAQFPLPLHIDQINSDYLRETAKWGKLLSIVGFVSCGILVILAFFIGTLMSSLSPMSQMEDLQGESLARPSSMFGGAFLTILYLIIAAIYVLPCLYLYRFSTKMQLALYSSDQLDLTASFSNLKSLFKFMGILTIVMLCMYGLGILVVIFSFAAFF